MSKKLTLAQLKEALAKTSEPNEPAEDGTEREVPITVKDLYGTTKKNSKGEDFELVVVEYRNLQYDKLEEKRTPIFQHEQAGVLLALEPGTDYVIKMIKTAGYWVWSEATVKDSE